MTFDNAPPGALLRVSPLTRRIVAPNPGVFTYTGTCSYIIGEGELAIVDPGPAEASHIEALLAAIGGETLRYLLVTHTHRDHSPAARILQDKTGATIAGCAAYAPPPDLSVTGPGLDASHDRAYAPDVTLADGECLAFGGLTIEAVATPGHTTNHLCFALAEEATLFTGDHVMGWATTVIAPPDGSMREYFASLERLRGRDDRLYWPAHGGPVKEPQRYLRALLHHRRQREAAILERLEAGDETIVAIVARIYEGFDARLQRAAALSVFAHLEDLVERGLVRADGPATLEARYFKCGE
ncbi:MBL fold metallo-hydrolase [Methylosinus sp. H3A]|uniref:MBL fold metallo-hydrolase n=1 Tax=Methylosinus sp. H3A TaxID=2785786 RepID=UPI001FEDE2B2|nr:MBL fold metallo-hydrolase [Methylosinus sp. H3A]